MRKDERLMQLAENVLKNSVCLQPGERIYIETRGLSTLPMLEAFTAAAGKLGGIPFYFFNDVSTLKQFIINSSEEQIKAKFEMEMEILQKCQVFVMMRAEDDVFELSDVPTEKMSLYEKYLNPITRYRVDNTKWCVLRFPNHAKAAMSKMSLQAFEDFYFEACLVDYRKMGEAMKPLKDLMDRTDKVRIIAPDTHLEFSIGGLQAVCCDGKRNIPDGEVYTSPVKVSINGYVRFNTETVYGGTAFSNIYLKFENGRIIEGHSDVNDEAFQRYLNTDKGSRYMGEFALGVNPYVKSPVLDILFDEKISGSFHMAIGNSYKNESFNGNVSSVHWDLIQIQTEEKGGGEIWFDDVLIRKNGIFIIEELKGLNPENLI